MVQQLLRFAPPLVLFLALTFASTAATVNNDDSCDIAVMPAATLLLPSTAACPISGFSRAEGRYSVNLGAAALGNGCSPQAPISETTSGNAIIGPLPNENP